MYKRQALAIAAAFTKEGAVAAATLADPTNALGFLERILTASGSKAEAAPNTGGSGSGGTPAADPPPAPAAPTPAVPAVPAAAGGAAGTTAAGSAATQSATGPAANETVSTADMAELAELAKQALGTPLKDDDGDDEMVGDGEQTSEKAGKRTKTDKQK